MTRRLPELLALLPTEKGRPAKGGLVLMRVTYYIERSFLTWSAV